MRLGYIVGIVFFVVMCGILFGVVQNESLITDALESNMESLMMVQKAVEDIGWGSVFTAPQAIFGYFNSLFQVVWQALNTPFEEGMWVLVNYVTLVPFVAAIVLGLILAVIAIVRKSA